MNSKFNPIPKAPLTVTSQYQSLIKKNPKIPEKRESPPKEAPTPAFRPSSPVKKPPLPDEKYSMKIKLSGDKAEDKEIIRSAFTLFPTNTPPRINEKEREIELEFHSKDINGNPNLRKLQEMLNNN